MPRTNLNDSILAGCDFTGANLMDASFSGSDLDGAVFVDANLRKAHFTNTPYGPTIGSRLDYMFRSVNKITEGTSFPTVSSPDFSCADLRDADFQGHSVFLIYSNDLKNQS